MELTAAEALRGYFTGRPATAPQPEAASFPQLMAQLSGEFQQVMNQSGQQAQAAMLDQGSGHALVTTLAQSQLALETVVAVRNKVVEAYQELLRMPV